MLLAATLFVCVALLVREVNLLRERATISQSLDEVSLSQQSVRDGTRRLAEDLFVLQNLLLERNLLQKSELMRARGRLIEQPRRKAEERTAMLRHISAEKVPFVLEDADGHVH